MICFIEVARVVKTNCIVNEIYVSFVIFSCFILGLENF